MAWHRIQYANGHVIFSVPGVTEYAYCLFYFRACKTFQEVSEYFNFQSTTDNMLNLYELTEYSIWL